MLTSEHVKRVLSDMVGIYEKMCFDRSCFEDYEEALADYNKTYALLIDIFRQSMQEPTTGEK